MRKAGYHFNSDTLSFDKIESSLRKRLWRLFKKFFSSFSLAIVMLYLVYAFIDSPKEKLLKRKYEEVLTQYSLLSNKVEHLDNVLKDMESRDDNIYRVIFETDPIPSSIRRAGSGGVDQYEHLRQIDNADLIIGTAKKIDELSDTVDTNYLSNFGYTREEILAENDIEFNSLSEMETKHEELNLGDIISDAYVYAVENTGDSDGEKVDVAIVPAGTVRDTYTKGNITVEQVYNSFSLGTGKDGLAGYPLISAYLTGKELKTVAEVDASISDFMTIARLYCSGMNFTYNPHRMILNKVTDCYLTGKDGEREEIQDDKLYHVVTDLYTGRMLGSVLDKSYGLISIVPKDKNGNPIENLEDYAVMDGKKELKAWVAIAEYMQSFEDTDKDGIANVPEYYDTTHERKVADNSKNIINLIKHPNKFAVAIVGICIVVVGVILLLIFGIVKIIRRRR